MKKITFNKKLDKIDTPASVAIADKVRTLTANGIQIARMQTGEPYFNTPKYIVEAAHKAMLKGYTHYSTSQGLPDLRKAISIWYKEEYNKKISPENIIINNGAIHSIFCILSTLINPEDEVMIPEPFWPQYKYISILSGANVKTIDTSSNNGRLTKEMFEKSISVKSKVLIINNPCNPTGLIYSKNEINALLKLAIKNNIYIIFDEVYSRITYTDNFCSVFNSDFYEEAKKLIIYVNSFSKTFAMTGWRVGYIILPEHLLKNVLKVSQNSITNVNTFCQYGAKVAIEKRKEHKREFIYMFDMYKKRYDELISLLSSKNIDFISPEGAFYFFIKSGKPSKQFAIDLLENERIAVVPGIAYGENFDEYYRISYAVDEYSFRKRSLCRQ